MKRTPAAVGIVGVGRQGMRHLNACAGLPQANVTAVCDTSDEALQRALANGGEARAYTDAQAMLGAETLDLLIVSTSAQTHHDLVVAAARAGVGAIFCEKPMAVSLAQADAMIAECQRAGVTLAVNHTRRWAPFYQDLLATLGAGALGRIMDIHYTCGGGRLGSNGGHFFDLARMLTGSEAASVAGRIDPTADDDPRGVSFSDPGGIANVRFASGASLTVNMSGDLGVPPFLTVTSTDGRVVVNELAGRCTTFSRDGQHRDKPPHARYFLPMTEVATTFEPLSPDALASAAIADLLAGGPPRCSAADGRAALELSIAVHASSEQGGSPVGLPLAGDARNRTFAWA